MTVSYNDNDITITSTKLSNFGIITSATLNAYLDCATTKYTKTVSSSDVTSNAFTIDETLFSQTTLADKLVSLILTVVYNNGDSTTVEKSCIFLNKETSCSIAKQVAEVADYELEADFYLLANAHLGACTCQDFCNIKKRVDHVLENC